MAALRHVLFAFTSVLIPAAALAATYSARVRWQPSSASTVAGYRIYQRSTSGSYGAPQQAGMPTSAADETMSFVVSGLDVRTDYVFAVTAYLGSGVESSLSNEIPIGYAQVAPLVDSDGDGLHDGAEDVNLNRIVDPGETDPNDPDTDGDGVPDGPDRCQGTAPGAPVNSSGCSCAQISCNNGNACDGVETCVAGVCQPGAPLNCDDGKPCTSDSCTASTGCVHTPVSGCTACTASSQCNDGNPCTTDTCTAGHCQSIAAPNGTACNDGNVCNGAETCQAGRCTAGAPVNCDDGNACTTDGCDPILGQCTHLSLPGCCTTNSDCADRDACTINERCEAGACVSDPLVCDAAAPCTRAVCDPRVGCTTHPLPDGTACVASDPCGQNSVCTGGICEGPAATVTPGGEPTGVQLEVSSFFMKRLTKHSWRLVAIGSFAAPLGLDLPGSPFTVALIDAGGLPFYQATVEGSEFTRTGDHYLYDGEDSISDNGLKKVELWAMGEVAQVSMTVKVPASVADAAAALVVRANDVDLPGSGITWLITIGNLCVRNTTLLCPTNGSRLKRCK